METVRNHILTKPWIWLALMAGISFVLWGTFYGDPTIYLSYAKNGVVFFNPGEFSSGATSPLWALLLGMSPTAFGLKALSLVVALACVWVWWEVGKIQGHPHFICAALIGIYGIPLVMGYETGLFLLVVGVLILNPGHKATVVLIALLPFIRPEAFLLTLLYSLSGWRTAIKVLSPILLWWGGMQVLAGSWSSSAVTRGLAYLSGNQPMVNVVRYSAVLFPLILVVGALTNKRRTAIALSIVGGWLVYCGLSAAVRESRKPYDFDTITGKREAAWINANLVCGTIEMHEVQIRYWLSDRFRVVSDEGLTGTGQADYRITDKAERPIMSWPDPPEGFRGWKYLSE